MTVKIINIHNNNLSSEKIDCFYLLLQLCESASDASF